MASGWEQTRPPVLRAAHQTHPSPVRHGFLGSRLRTPASSPPSLTTQQLPSACGWCHQPPQRPCTPELLVMPRTLPACADHTTPAGRRVLTVGYRLARRCASSGRLRLHSRCGRDPAALGLRGLRRSVREAKRESRGEQGLTPVMVHLHTGPGRLLARTPAASKLASLVVSPKLSGAPAPNRATRATIAFPVAVGKTTQILVHQLVSGITVARTTDTDA